MATVAVLGEDGRTISRGLHEDDGRELARTIHATTGEKVTLVWPGDPREDEIVGAVEESDDEPKPKAKKPKAA